MAKKNLLSLLLLGTEVDLLEEVATTLLALPTTEEATDTEETLTSTSITEVMAITTATTTDTTTSMLNAELTAQLAALMADAPQKKNVEPLPSLDLSFS